MSFCFDADIKSMKLINDIAERLSKILYGNSFSIPFDFCSAQHTP